MQGYAWLVLALPLLGFVLNGAVGRRLERQWEAQGRPRYGRAVAWIGCGTIGLAFIITLIAYGQLLSWTQLEQVTKSNFNYYTWVTSGGLKISFGMLIDPLSTMMLLIVTGVGFLIHVYSVGYMHEDRDFSRFFAYMNLFIFSMVMLVVANNFLFLLVGWALVGLSSYLLIGFWYQNMSALLAARKAFIMNVIGDVGIMIAIFTMFRRFGTIDYDGVFSRAGSFHSGDHVITAIALLLLIGAVAKSAQLPLHTWLPDAMEGPTPVSALIHAATMVTAGVYLVARCHVLFDLAPFAQLMVAGLGTVTAFIAATIAIVQTDIKRVLAYSTMSQIGYMFLGVGDGAYASGMFHLMTHAFFKALLFMGAGNVIHALGGEQDLRKMGGLRSRLPGTYLLFTIGVFAIAGIPPLAGFWSKDEILNHTLTLGDWHIALWVTGEITAALTVFYMFRLWYLCFHGRSRVERQVATHLHEAPGVMLAPMAILGVLSVGGGFLQIPSSTLITDWLTPNFVLQYAQVPSRHFADIAWNWWAFALIICLIVGAWAVARDLYGQGLRGAVRGPLRLAYVFLVQKWYFDELYNLLVERTTYAVAQLSWWLDRHTIDGVVNGVARGVGDASDDLRPVESGFVRTYALSLFAGVVLVVAIAVSQR